MYLKIKAIPDAKHEKVEQVKEDEFRIWTKMPAEHNLANHRIIEILKEMYPSQRVRLISGHTSSSKIVSID